MLTELLMWRLINCEFVTGGLIGSFWNKRSARGHRGNQVVEKASLISAEMCAAVVRRLPNVHFPPPSCSRFPQTDEETTDALTARKKRSRSIFFASQLYRGFRVTLLATHKHDTEEWNQTSAQTHRVYNL